MRNIHLVSIDPQNDFCAVGDPGINWTGNPIEDNKISATLPDYQKRGALYVPGADKDMDRLAALIEANIDRIQDIHVTIDSHHVIDVAHPGFWQDSNGNNPSPFTMITVDDVEQGRWVPVKPAFHKRALEYVRQLRDNARFVLVIWPVHCEIGSWGHGIYPAVSKALRRWQSERIATVDFVTKGSNIFTEHYSAIQADVPDADDPTTQLNTSFIDTLQTADEIWFTGEALNFCVNYTMSDLISNFGAETIKKMRLITDTTSAVPDPPGSTAFSEMTDNFLQSFKDAGGELLTTADLMPVAA